MQDDNRRAFLKGAGAFAISSSAHRILGANDRVNVAVIGIGGRGSDHLRTWLVTPGTQVAGLCDVNQAARERAQAEINRREQPKAKEFTDMRQLFEDKEIDAVSMATPNHWHSLGTIWACQAGKDVYCEKPASHNIFESRKMVEAARKYKRMVQIGSQNRSRPHVIKAMNLLQQGVIGKVYLAKGLCFKRRKSIGHTPDEATPAGVNWDLFLGPAPMRAFSMNRFRYNWHWFWDTGNGDIGNQGIHEMDMARWGAAHGLPARVVSTGGKYIYEDDQETPNTQIATFDYGDLEIMFEVRGIITGGECGLEPRGGNTVGDLFFGSDGWMALDGSGFKVYKGEDRKLVMDEKPGPQEGGDTGGHFRNFLTAVRSRKFEDLTADVEIGATSAVLVHLANISYRLKRALRFDPVTWTFIGDPEANKMITREYRKPYVVPERV